MVGREVQHLVAVREHDFLLARLALRPLRDADQRNAVHALLLQHVGGHGHLTLAPSMTSRSGAGYSPATMRAHRRVSASRIAA